MIIKVNETGKRLDKFLQEETDYSRTLIQKMIESDYIFVNEKKVKGSYLVKEDDEINIKEGFIKETNIEGEDIQIDVVYEDEDLLVINKPSGMVVHPGNGNSSGTLVNALIAYTEDLSDEGGIVRPGIVHRIDKDTSGLIVIAKNNKSHELLSDGFKNKSINREYLALVIGEIKNDTGVIDAPIGRDPHDRKKMSVTENNSKNAVTHFKVLKRYQGYTLINLKLETGRTHQIRVHMKYIGFPVFNDPVYTKNQTTEFGQFLHSCSLDFIHPITNKKLHFECELPKEFNDFLKGLEEINDHDM